MLTRKQMKLFDLIETGMHENGVAPSYDELRQTLGLASKSSIHSMMNALEARGYIRRLRYKARAIEILKPRDRGGLPNPYLPKPRQTADAVYDIPLIGAVTAGPPVVVWESTHRYVTVPPAFAPPHGEHYALDVRGDSMTDAGINEGDIVVIRRQSSANSGDIVVALVDGENTLKRLQIDLEQQTVKLIAENPAYEDMEFENDEIEVQGRMVSLLRRYDAADMPTPNEEGEEVSDREE